MLRFFRIHSKEHLLFLFQEACEGVGTRQQIYSSFRRCTALNRMDSAQPGGLNLVLCHLHHSGEGLLGLFSIQIQSHHMGFNIYAHLP